MALSVTQPVGLEQGQAGSERTLVYLSYSHKDKKWRQRLRQILDADPAIRDLIWDDTKIPASGNWRKEIVDHVARARVMIMLGSPDYFAPSCGAAELEIKPALEAYQKGEMSILWFRVREHSISTAPVRDIMAATGPGAVPLETLSPSEQDAELRKIHQLVLIILGRATDTMSTQPTPGFPASSTSPVPPAVAAQLPSTALSIWQKKLAFLQAEEAKAADAEQKFAIQQRIEEAKEKIRELGGTP